MAECDEMFSTQMRKATRKVHSLSDKLVNAKFAVSLRDTTVWSGGIFVFYHVFAQLEDAARRLPDAELNRLYALHADMWRKKYFEADLEHYLGKDWREIPKAPELEKYIARLKSIESNNPLLLLVYVYHLYLGLLSGGQILIKKRGRVETANEDGYKDQLFHFPGVEIKLLREQIRNTLNEISKTLSEEQKRDLIEESKMVFKMNNLIIGTVKGQSRYLKSILYKASAVALVVAISVYAFVHE